MAHDMIRQKQMLGFDMTKKGDQRCFIDIAVGGARVGRVTFILYSHLTPRTANNFVHLCKGMGRQKKSSLSSHS